MKGTVDPASRRETAAATCWGPTASSVAMRASMDCIRTAGFSETGAHYAEHTQVQQDLRFPCAWRKGTPRPHRKVGRQWPMPRDRHQLTSRQKTPQANSATPKVIFAISQRPRRRVFRTPLAFEDYKGCIRAARRDCPDRRSPLQDGQTARYSSSCPAL